ncbi:hypothetical protein Taro_044689 [Colocasia esculenta]|uniref:Uncharacterized protein n=1 Tax=Colocasia esculenta TaxID=4460 RepID=A0A843WMJ4_COLES|nr:hypothetical protein [Colocasia esculenta]
MGLRPCGPQVVVFSWSPQLLDLFTWSGAQLDLSSVAARLRGRPVLVCPSQSLVSRTSSGGSCVAVSTVARTPVWVRARRTFLGRRPVRSRAVAVQGQHPQQCSVASCLLPSVVPRGMPQALVLSFSFLEIWLCKLVKKYIWNGVFLCIFTDWLCGIPCEASARSRETDSDQARYRFNGLDEVLRHSWYQSKKFEMADRRDWGGGGDDPEESTQRMIERIWESLTDIRARMDQQAPVPPATVPPVVGGAVPEAPVPPPPGVEVPFVAPSPPPPPMLVAEEPVMQVENSEPRRSGAGSAPPAV